MLVFKYQNDKNTPPLCDLSSITVNHTQKALNLIVESSQEIFLHSPESQWYIMESITYVSIKRKLHYSRNLQINLQTIERYEEMKTILYYL